MYNLLQLCISSPNCDSAWTKTRDYIEFAKKSNECEIVFGGTYDDSVDFISHLRELLFSQSQSIQFSFVQTLIVVSSTSKPNFTDLDQIGYFITPTVVLTTNPFNKLMIEEIFAPVLTVYVYKVRSLNYLTKIIITSSVTSFVHNFKGKKSEIYI
jgi:hypothetical protein